MGSDDTGREQQYRGAMTAALNDEETSPTHQVLLLCWSSGASDEGRGWALCSVRWCGRWAAPRAAESTGEWGWPWAVWMV